MKQTAEHVLSHAIHPICPRDDHRMHYESKGISWKELPEDRREQTLASYHCKFEGCSVRYDLENGYFTVVNTPEQPYFLEEPGVNLRRCPIHGTWLYKSAERREAAPYSWRCGVSDCDYVYSQSAGQAAAR
jgi:hypothetical protein